SIRQNYNEIADLCKSSGEPMYLTKNGEGDLVVMDIETFSRREKMLKLRKNCSLYKRIVWRAVLV
ncbi:type II toxin-antitoxin system Phd/YefM family antitoxin, partial [Paenibacillus cisolokensis]|uniref:type II toxin-antitoxin system Phd/YefM family antitoxin n=1 Tax=Paenibacillus cisolokensis TaxID=1658519 RepID=UPI001FD0A182